MLPSDWLLAVVLTTTLGAARALPVVWMVAPLGGPRLPAAVRVGFALLLALVASPVLAATAGADQLVGVSPLHFTLMIAREVLIGLCLALVASAVFRAAEIAGRLADSLRGANVAEILVPTAEERASPLGVLYLLLATLVFLHIGGVPRVIDALVGSYEAIPIAGGLGEVQARRAAFVVAVVAAKLVGAGVALAAPVIVALWLTDLALGLIARAAPAVPVYFVGLPLKGLLAIGIVLLGLGALETALAGSAANWLRMLRQTADAFR